MRVLELLARVPSGGTAAWLLVDRMGSVRNVVDNTGAVIDTITYDGYGNVMAETSPTNGGQYKYDAYRYDSETGWLRPDPSLRPYYNPATGRWMSQDPWSFGVGDYDLYRYVGNNPTNSTDPSGLADEVRLVPRVSIDRTQSVIPQAGVEGGFYWPVLWKLQPVEKGGGMTRARVGGW